jgi:lysozyme
MSSARVCCTTAQDEGIRETERAVKAKVKHQQLTQEQFDALVSFAYNVGASGAKEVLKDVDAGSLEMAAFRMMQNVKAKVREKDGAVKKDKAGNTVWVVLPGLITRRVAESAPFRHVEIDTNLNLNLSVHE